MLKVLHQFFLFIYIMITLSSLTYSDNTKNVLIIHSYHQGLEWTDNISKGIESELGKNRDIKIYYEYLDTKRNFSEKYYEQLLKLYEEKLGQITFDLIITSDNAALNFALENREKLYKDIPIIFSGVNYFEAESIEGYKNIAGVKEDADYKSTLDLIPEVFPNITNILIVLDKTLTGNSIAADLEPILKDYKKAKVELYRDFSMIELQDRVSMLCNNSAIFILTLNRDNTGKFFTYRESIEKLNEASLCPIFGSWDFYLGKGIVGGMITSSFLQGETAGKLAMEFFNTGIFPDRKILDSKNLYMFDKNILDKFNISEKSLDFDKIVINKQEKSKNLKLKIIIILLLILATSLKISLEFKKNNQILLEQKISERTNELEKVNQKLQIITETDELTKLYNRRYILRELEFEMKSCRESDRNLWIIMLDLDNFKSINDNYGHGAGDIVLVNIASILKKYFCKVGRYGGEEFLAIAKDKTEYEVLQILNSVLDSVSALEFNFSDLKTTISGGVVKFNKEMYIDELIKSADDLLYKAKRNGKNKFEI